MDISSLESLIRTHPILSISIGVYTIANITALCLAFSERRKIRRAEEKIHFCKERLKEQINYVNRHPSMLEDPYTKSLYEETVSALKEN